MSVFISYDREHGAVAHLLAYILTSHDIECAVDRQLPVGEPFDDSIKELIRDLEKGDIAQLLG